MFTGQIKNCLAKLLLSAAAILSAQQATLASDANTPGIKGLAHICIYTKNNQEAVKFYTETLGFKLIHETELKSGFKYALVRQGTCIIELLEPKDVARSTQRLAGVIDHIAIEVDDINKAYENLKAKKVSFKTGVMDAPNLFGGVRIAFFRGPSGETFELFEYLQPVPGLQETQAAQLAEIPDAGGVYQAGNGKIFHRHACGSRVN